MAGDDWKDSFDIPMAIVDLMYRQAIVWSCMYFSPMVTWISVFATFITFFSKKHYVTIYCSRPKKALGVVKQLKFFYGNMLFALMVSFISFIYFLKRKPLCGPHNINLESNGDIDILSQFNIQSQDNMPNYVKIGLEYLTNLIIILPLLFLSWIYLLTLRNKKNKFYVRSMQFKEQLIEEKQEKKQILQEYNIQL